jgi:hypothetical protein
VVRIFFYYYLLVEIVGLNHGLELRLNLFVIKI